MSPLEQEILRILDFDSAYLTTALNEASGKEKLANTAMIVNGKVGLVKEIYPEKGQVHVLFPDGGRIVTVSSLEVFLPETGIYYHKNFAVYIEKLAKKQWKKSFHADFYKIKSFNGSPPDNDIDLVTFLHTAKNIPFYLSKVGRLFYRHQIIGEEIPWAVAYGDTTKHIKLYENTHYQGLLDYIKKENLPWEIVQ